MGKFLTSLKFAWRGVPALFGSQRNAKIQLAIAVLVIVAGFVFSIGRLVWCAVVLCIALVFAAEGVNTAIETLADAVHPDQHPLVGRAKDIDAQCCGAIVEKFLGDIFKGFAGFGDVARDG